jgi:hypothetical protein
MSQIDWKSAPEGATHFGPETDTHCESWYRVEGGKIISFVPTGDYPFVLTKAQAGSGYYHAIDELIEPWTGEGLPPVGTVCERHASGDLWERARIKYQQANICVWEVFGLAVERCSDSAHQMVFRPIRTPEHIAAAEREETLQEIASTIGRVTFYEDAEALYALGYRKQVTK